MTLLDSFRLKTTLCFLFCFYFLLDSSAQNTDATVLANQFNSLQGKNLQEKLYVHLDRSTYLVGETIWFKVNCMNENNHKPLDISKVVYVELLDTANKPIFQTKIKMEEGFGNGAIILPPSIASSHYVFRAYTHWMKNNSPSFYFHQKILIINAFNNLGLKANKEVDKFDIQFFPEGGNLVQNIESKIGFKAMRNGKGFDCNGFVLNLKNDTIVKFSAVNFGLGSFVFKPMANDKYRVFIKNNGKFMESNLPQIYEKGYVLRVYEIDSTQLKLTIRCNDIESENIYLLAHTRHSLKYSLADKIQNGKAEFLIDKRKLDKGISHFTIFNAQKQPVCERLYFIKPQSSFKIDCKTEKGKYKTREKVSVDITTQNSTAFKLAANASLAVFKLDSIGAESENDIQSYFFLASDIKGTIESPSYYFQSNTQIEADNLMLTQGWSRFKWDQLFDTTQRKVLFFPEFHNHILQVKVVDSVSGNVAENVTTFLSIPGKRIWFQNAISNRDGIANFKLNEIYGAKELVMQTNSIGSRVYKLATISAYSKEYASPFYKTNLVLSENRSYALLNRNIAMQTQNIFKPLSFSSLNVLADSLPFFSRGDDNYNLDDYTRFKTMWEVIKEYVVSVSMRKRKGKLHFSLADSRIRNNSLDDPLVLLDGVPVSNLDSLMEINPLKIKNINVVTQKYVLGSIIYNGIVSFSSYEGDLGGYSLEKNWTVVDFESIQINKEFYSPQYATKAQIESRMPDFRNLLYWNPNIEIDKTKNIDFYTSDMEGNYLIVVQGTDKNGNFGSAHWQFEVKK